MNGELAAIFIKIVNMSISGGWVCAAVLVLRLLLQKAPKGGGMAVGGTRVCGRSERNPCAQYAAAFHHRRKAAHRRGRESLEVRAGDRILTAARSLRSSAAVCAAELSFSPQA